MDALYPLSLKLAGRRVLIVGGGSLARQKLHGLAPTGALVRVVAPYFAPELTPELTQAFAPGRVELIQQRFRAGHLRDVALAFGATDDPAVNRRVVAAARRRGILANAVDDPEHCDFYTPAVLRRHGLELAISTGGGFPGFTRAVREVLEAWLPDGHASALAGLFRLRRALLESPIGPAERGRVLRDLARRIADDYLTPAGAGPQRAHDSGAGHAAGDAVPHPATLPPGATPDAPSPRPQQEHS